MRGIVRGLAISALATIIAGVVVWLIAKATGRSRSGARSMTLTRPWIIAVAAAELLTYPAYTIAYRSLAQVHGEKPMSHAIAARIVVAGFGPFALLGGFGIDKQALAAVHDDERGARVKVLSLGALEWAVLAPVTSACAIVLLLQDSSIMGALLWPWAIAVPVGFAFAAWASSPDRVKRLSSSAAARSSRWPRRSTASLRYGRSCCTRSSTAGRGLGRCSTGRSTSARSTPPLACSGSGWTSA